MATANKFMKNILVPIDFSRVSIQALEVAHDISLRTKSSITLLHVVEEHGPHSVAIDEKGRARRGELFTFRSIEESRDRLNQFILDSRFQDVVINGELRTGQALNNIQALIEEYQVDLVVMGTQGRDAIKDKLIGTLTERVLRHARCPVLTVGKRPVSMLFSDIVYPTALLAGEEKFGRFVRMAQEAYNASVHLVWINTPGGFQREKVVRKALAEFGEKLAIKKFEAHIFSDLQVVDGVMNFAEMMDADMVALATHGREGFANLINGSVAEDVIARKAFPVLSYVLPAASRGQRSNVRPFPI